MLLALCTGASVFAQINYEKGHFFTLQNEKVTCFIKNVDWLNNPSSFDYKLSEDGDVLTASTDNVSEFSVADYTYIRYAGPIDRAGNLLSNLSNVRNPEFNDENLFLRVMVNGDAKLYSYIDGNLTRYFFKTSDGAIEPLVYKKYYKTSLIVAENNQFRQQLSNALACDDISQGAISSVGYRKKDLINLFKQYNSCISGDYSEEKKTKKKGYFKLNIRPGVTMNTFRIRRLIQLVDFGPYEYDTGNIIGYQMGAELEYVLPFNKNKWSIIVEPLYNSFNSEAAAQTAVPEIARINYKTFELPIGLRHYFYLGNKGKIFINGSYTLIFDLNSEFATSRFGSSFGSRGANQSFGIGFNYNDRYSIEGRIDTKRSGGFFQATRNRVAEVSSFSIILGVNLF